MEDGTWSGQPLRKLLMPVVNFSDVDAKMVAEDSANVWTLFFSVLASVCVEAYVTVNDLTNDLCMNSKALFLVT